MMLHESNLVSIRMVIPNVGVNQRFAGKAIFRRNWSLDIPMTIADDEFYVDWVSNSFPAGHASEMIGRNMWYRLMEEKVNG